MLLLVIITNRLIKRFVVVSNSRFIVDSTTYAMSGITSVKKGVIIPSKTPAIVCFLIGFFSLLIFASIWGKIIGIALMILAFFIFRSLKKEHVVILKSASGESQALTNTNSDYIDEVIVAINNALVHRG